MQLKNTKGKTYANKNNGNRKLFTGKNVSNTDLEKYVDTSDEWISSRTGIKNRRIAVHETTAGMAAEAAKKALEMAGKEAIDVELIVLATVTPDYYTPSAACQVQAELGADNAIAFDVNAACSGFVFALNVAKMYIETGFVKNALVIGAETLSKILDWTIVEPACCLEMEQVQRIWKNLTRELSV